MLQAPGKVMCNERTRLRKTDKMKSLCHRHTSNNPKSDPQLQAMKLLEVPMMRRTFTSGTCRTVDISTTDHAVELRSTSDELPVPNLNKSTPKPAPSNFKKPPCLSTNNTQRQNVTWDHAEHVLTDNTAF